ncbi:MAG: hypothetical protein HC902_10350 [Calothrix sp. SM1_5_4]|nr:hypothetical protein [Calothrix sp. SM1_5_4]
MAKKKATKKTTKKAKSAKTAVKKKAAPAKKTAAKAGGKRKPNASFMKPLTVSEALAAVVGAGALPRTEIVKNLWKYIKKHGLQDNKNKRNINADERLKAIFGKPVVNMFEMTKLIGKHLK